MFLSRFNNVVYCVDRSIRDSTNAITARGTHTPAVHSVSVDTLVNVDPAIKVHLNRFLRLNEPYVFTYQENPKSTEHCIDTGSAVPIFSLPGRLSPEKAKAARTAIDVMLQQGISLCFTYVLVPG